MYDALVEARGEDRTTRYVETTTQAGDWLRQNVAGHDVVLVKASRGGRLERVADTLIDEQVGDANGHEHGQRDGEEHPS